MRFLYSTLRIYSLLAFLPAAGFAQIAAPDFTCTRSSAGAITLNWVNQSAAACGPYEATEIFRATSADGPYTQLASLSDPTQTSYTDPNPTGELRYYFLRYRYNCPGVAVLDSDTLDSFIPVTPVIQYLGVEDNEIVIDWLASTSPEVTGYIILEVTPTAFVPVDTVYGVTDYRLAFGQADPDPAGRSFRLVALDGCGNDSPQGSVVSPAGLTGQGGSGCTSDITLVPDQADIQTYLPATALELFVSVNGGPFNAAGTFPPSVTTIAYRDANDGEDLCFYLEAVLANNFGRARSAVFCQSVMITQPLRDFPLYGVELDDAGNFLFQYADDLLQPVPADAQLTARRRSGVLETEPLPGPVFGSGGQLTVPSLADQLSSGETLSFRLTDACGREVNTNEVEPVYLNVRENFPGSNQLSWSPLVNGLDGNITYDVFRADVGAVLIPLASDLATLSFVDNLPAGNSGETCYLVRARFRPAGAGPVQSFVFGSNVACVTPVPEVFIPNAFSPNGDGVNDVFRPFFSSLPAAGVYEMLVFNRWGGLVFRAEDPLDGWEGTSSGNRPAEAGTYLYTLRYTVEEGDTRQRSGTVNLLR